MFGGSSSSKEESDQPVSPGPATVVSDSSPTSGADVDGGNAGGPMSPSARGADVDSIPEEAVDCEDGSTSGQSNKRHSTNSLSNVTSGVPIADKKRRSSGVGSKASSLLASARSSFSFGNSSKAGASGATSGSGGGSSEPRQTAFQKLGKHDPALAVPQGQHNNSAGESAPGPRSTFQVGVWEDRNKKCRRTMEDTHAFLYNFLPTPAPVVDGVKGQDTIDDDGISKASSTHDTDVETVSGTASMSFPPSNDMIETDNGYFAIFDGHAGSFAADWCGKKLHVILEDVIRKHPNVPIPELLDMTFTSVDSQLEKLPSKSSGCTAAIAVLRWEDRVPNDRSATGSQAMAPAAAKAAAITKGSAETGGSGIDAGSGAGTSEVGENASVSPSTPSSPADPVAKLRSAATKHRVLYTANVGDARIILCRNGHALRLSYDHKGSDENEGKRIANAGGLIVNNRVNGVLAVTRALGDAYMKELVTGHPYTTETVIVPDTDEFLIIACDGVGKLKMLLQGTMFILDC